MVEATGTKMQLIWAYNKVYDTIRHPDLCLYKGIGSVLDIEASDFLQYLREEIDSASVQKVLDTWKALRDPKSEGRGIQDRNAMLAEDAFGAEEGSARRAVK